MSVNISVREGDSSRVFSNVDKVTFNIPTGGTVDFVPEGEADKYATTTELTVRENGTYEAITAGAVGFSKVVVNVPNAAGNKGDDYLREFLITNISAKALRPNIHRSTTSWEWDEGREEGEAIKTFKSTSNSLHDEYIEVSGNSVKAMFEKYIKPVDFNSIKEDETSLLTADGKQVYWVDIADFSLGCTTVSPKTYNDKITDYVLDMYVCRRLKADGPAEIFSKMSLSASEVTVETETKYNISSSVDLGNASMAYAETPTEKALITGLTSTNGTMYGEKIHEDIITGDVECKKIRDNIEYDDYLLKIYADQAEADADVGIVPDDLIGIIKMG